MGKNKDLKNRIDQTVKDGTEPWKIYQQVQEQYAQQGKKKTYPNMPADHIRYDPKAPGNDISKLKKKMSSKVPPGIQQMIEPFMTMIASGDKDSPEFKKNMKQMMKKFGANFKSPYE